jgi:hypothetical protein
MAPDIIFQSSWVRLVLAVFFTVSGALAILLLVFASPSFWYVPCAVLWALFGPIWIDRPSLAAGLSIFPILGIAVLVFQSLPDFRRTDNIYKFLLLCVVIALVLIGVSFRERAARRIIPVAVSFGLVLAAFLVDRGFTDKLAIHSYSMNWSADGVAPWGRVSTDEKGELPVVIYRRVNGDYCFDEIFSSELKARLTASNKPVVTVEYNGFSDFGHERAYNVRSVDGFILNVRYRPLHPEESFRGYGGRTGSVDCPRYPSLCATLVDGNRFLDGTLQATP